MSIKYIQLPVCKLEAFTAAATTSFDASGFLYNDGTTAVAAADIGDVCFATLEPKTAREELISFTIASVTAGGVATLTVTRGLSQKSPYGTGGASFDHEAGSDLTISNNPGLFDKLTAKANDETITGSWAFPATPTTTTNPVTKGHFDDNAVIDTGAQTIAGVKTFTSPITIPDGVADTDAISKLQNETYTGGLDAANVKKTGDQTIAGVKTFTSSPVVPDATAANQPYTKGQHDADAVASSAVASPTVRGSSKLDIVADAPLDPEVLTATADRAAAMLGNDGTPSATNTFVTETGQMVATGFGDGTDGDVTISGTTTLTADMQYQNLTVTGTLVTDGYVIYVKDTIDGAGTIRHSSPVAGTDGVTQTAGSSYIGGGGGGGGAASGAVVIYATIWAGSFTIEAIGDSGGDGADCILATGVVDTGVSGNSERGSGSLKGLAGGAGGNRKNDSFTAGVAGVAGTSIPATEMSLADDGQNGGGGGAGDNAPGGGGGTGGNSDLPIYSPQNYKYLLQGLWGLDSGRLMKEIRNNAGSGGGGTGGQDNSDNASGGGGGGGGGNGGDAFIVYKSKAWTGTSTLTGGVGGTGGTGLTGLSTGTDGSNGVTGDNGTLIEVAYNDLL